MPDSSLPERVATLEADSDHAHTAIDRVECTVADIQQRVTRVETILTNDIPHQIQALQGKMRWVDGKVWALVALLLTLVFQHIFAGR